MIKIMIVDDASIIRSKLNKIVSENGYQVVAEAVNGLDAVTKYRLNRPDIVTMDITMPIMDGLESLKKILEIDSNAKVIMLSAMSQRVIVLEAISAGAKNYIVKPFENSKVLEVINSVANLK